jgi:ABC-type molybdate transport system substrate-binding protein
VFHKADALKPGASAALEKKALQLVGGPDAPTAPPGHSVYGMLLAEGKADIFLTYCTNAIEAVRDNSGIRIVQLPEQLAVAADYGLTVVTGASVNAYRLAMFILSADGQRALAAHGFAAPALPR